jgi:prepilin-type N-terminal cleavage/methylation domain-containing protein
MRFRSGRRAGFTLLEVLIAVGIFAFAALGLLLALDSALDGARATQRDAAVRDGLANRLAGLSVGSLRPVSSDETENGVTYHLEVQREEVTNAEKTILRGFWRLKVKAEWTGGGSPQTWEVSHLVYRSDA